MKTKSKNLTRNIMAMPLLVLLATGCSKEVSDLNEFIAQTKAASVGSVRPIPQFKPYLNFAYSASDLRDPFVATVNIIEEPGIVKNSLQPENNRPKQYLESFPLDALSMVGTLEQNKNTWGLIKDPQNVVHRVQLDNYMGKNGGRIQKITDTKIHLVEIVPDGIGGYIERETSIAVGNK